MASASAVGSGRRCSRRSSGGVPRRANARSWVTARRARPAARPARRQLVREGRRQPAQDEARRPRGPPPGAPARGRAPSAPGALRGRKRSVSSPRARAWRQRPLLPEPRDQRGARQLRHRPDRPQPEPREARPDVRVARQQPGRVGREEPLVVAGRDEDRRPALVGVRGGDRRGERRAGDPGARRARAGPGPSAAAIRATSRLLDPPEARQAVDVDGDPPERRVRDVARAGDPGAEDGEPLAGGLDARPGPRQARGRGRSPRARAGGRSRAGSPVARRAPGRADPRPPRSRPSRAVRRGRSGRVATSRRCRRPTASPSSPSPGGGAGGARAGAAGAWVSIDTRGPFGSVGAGPGGRAPAVRRRTGRRRRGRRGRGAARGRRGRPAGPGGPGRRPAGRPPRTGSRASARRPGGPYRLRATSTALRWPDDVPAQPDPARPPQLQAEAARLLDRGGQRPAQARGLQHDEQRPGAPCQRREPPEPVPDPLPGHRRVPAVRQVHHQQVHGPGGEQRARRARAPPRGPPASGPRATPGGRRARRPPRDRTRGRGPATRRSPRRPAPPRPSAARPSSGPRTRPRAARPWRCAAARPGRGSRPARRTPWGRRGRPRPGRACRDAG